MSDFKIEIDSNAHEVADVLEYTGQVIVDAARIAASNKAMGTVQTAIKRDVRAATGVAVGIIAKRMKLWRAGRKNNTARIFIGTLPISAFKAGGRVLARGGVSIPGAGGKVKVPNGFEAVMPSSSGRGFYQRKTHQRLPIRMITIKMADIARASANRQMATLAPQRFEAEFARYFQFQVGKKIQGMRAA